LDAARIVGVYTTEQARSLAPRTGFSLALEALKGGLDDAGLKASDLDAIYSSVTDWPLGRKGLPIPEEHFWARQLGVPMRWTASGFAFPAFLDAAAAIGSGLARTAAVVIGNCRLSGDDVTASWTRPANEFTGWTGSYTAVQYALVAQRYMHEYGDDALEAMASLAATVRNFGRVNPAAVYSGRGPFTASDVLASRPIASPLTLLMCASVNDGGCAMILTRGDVARDTPKTPIRILAGGNQLPYPAYIEAPVLHPVADESAFVRDGFARAGVEHKDIDVLELYDQFAIGILLELEMYGFCAPGEAAGLVKSGALELGGTYPMCTDGGNLSFSHNGFPYLFRIIEAVRQLRGEAPDMCLGGAHTFDPSMCRKARDPKVAFASGVLGAPTGCGTFAILARD
jgi:acetyl-CoA acetyltransferase